MGTTKGMHHLYSLYRYGGGKPVTLPGRVKAKPARLLKGARRQHIVDGVTDLLKSGRPSAFANEGAARAGLRSSLCLDGHRWAWADLEADLVVSEGLRRIGAERPSWEGGQPSYVDHGDFCVRCRRPMPDELVTGGRNQLFCSVECAAAVLEDRHRKDTAIGQRITRAAQALVRRELISPSPCQWCRKPFRPFRPQYTDEQRFCSKECRSAARVLHPEIECLACGTVFRTCKKSGGRQQKFCSPQCANSFGRTVEHRRICEACGEVFTTKAHNGQFCSPSCKTFESKHIRGVYAHHALSSRLFDYLFSAPIATRTKTFSSCP